MRKAALLLAVLSFPLVASAADPGDHFGSKGTIAPSGGIALYTSHRRDAYVIVLTLRPAAFYFPIDNLAVGGAIGWMRSWRDNSQTTYSLTPSVGYNVRLADAVSIFPHAGIGYSHSTLPSWGMPGYGPWHSTSLVLDIRAPALAHSGNFFVGAGPFLTTELILDSSVRADKTTNFGLATMIGGWF